MTFEEPQPNARGAPPAAAAPRINRLVWFRSLADLTKLRITLLSTLSAAAGYLLYSHRLEVGMATCAIGILLTAMGSCALNQYQDRDLDARMLRTRHRPIPAGTLSPETALAVSLLLISSGVLLLWRLFNRETALIALAAVAWYNLLYTYLKRIWAFAVVPGAVIGALPPVIGWTAAGGNPLDRPIIAVAFFLFLWQVPHFWLLLLDFGADYRQAGLPSLTEVFSTPQLVRVTGVWMLFTAASSLLLPLSLAAPSRWLIPGIAIAGSWFIWQAFRFVRRPPGSILPLFRAINIYALSIMALLIADALFS